MKYSDFIEINEKFQTSINLEYDLNKIEKVRSYIPTEQSVKILGTFLRSFYFNKETQNRASVLIGPYGRGKSHLLLVLAALTSMDLKRIPKKRLNMFSLSFVTKLPVSTLRLGFWLKQ